MSVEAALRVLFVEQPDKAADQPHEEQNGGCEHVRVAFRLQHDVNEKRDDRQRENQGGERVEE